MNEIALSHNSIEQLLEKVTKPGQYLGNEWGSARKSFDKARVRLAVSFPDTYELGMSNFGLKILYKLVNGREQFMADRTYAPQSDMELLLRQGAIPLWAWESRRALKEFELLGFSLQYELAYTNVLNMLELAQLPVESHLRKEIFPLIFGGGPSAVNPEPMARFMDFFMIGDGESAVPRIMEIVEEFRDKLDKADPAFVLQWSVLLKRRLLLRLASEAPGVYVPQLYKLSDVQDERRLGVNGKAEPLSSEELETFLSNSDFSCTVPGAAGASENAASIDVLNKLDAICSAKREIPPRVFRQTEPLNDDNQPSGGLVPYLALVHDREVLEVRRGCDRGCRFCQPGYTFLPVRERSSDDILRLSKQGLEKSGHEEYSMLSLCVSDYTSLHETVRALNREHSSKRSSLSFPSQRADRMNLDIAEELKAVRKSGITLAPEAGTERLRMVINKGLRHEQIISAIEAAYISGWSSVKLYYMCCLPTERDEDLKGIIDTLVEANEKCRLIRKSDPEKYRKGIEFTCTISNFVPKPFTPFQWFGVVDVKETVRKHNVLRQYLKESVLQTVTLNTTEPQITLLETVISRGDRGCSELIYRAWKSGCTFDAWDDRFQPAKWHEVAEEMGTTLEALSSTPREVGSAQPWDVVHVGLHTWWLQREWERALAVTETPNCTENICHACGVCTELDTNHELARPDPDLMKKNRFIKEIPVKAVEEKVHPSLSFEQPPEAPPNEVATRLRFVFTKTGDMRFIGHLDMQHLFVRAARRAGLNMAYSQGFNPSPRLSLASPLPIYFESEGEVAELDLADRIDASTFQQRLNAQLPPEVRLVKVVTLPDKPGSSLASVLGFARYRAELTGDQNPEQITLLERRVAEMLESDALMVDVPTNTKKAKKRKGSRGPRRNHHDGSSAAERPTQRNLREGIKSLVIKNTTPATLEMELASSSTLHIKPSEVLEHIDSNLRFRVTRLELKSSSGVSLIEYDRAGASDRDLAVSISP